MGFHLGNRVVKGGLFGDSGERGTFLNGKLACRLVKVVFGCRFNTVAVVEKVNVVKVTLDDNVL